MPLATRRQITLLIAALAGVLTLGVGIYGLWTGQHHAHSSAVSTTVSTASDRQRLTTRATTATTAPSLTVLPKTDDPIAYARAVASALFDWNTTSGYLPSDYEAPVLADADPSGEETAGLIADAATYLPTTDQWLDLATMNVAQTITIGSARIPSDWQTISSASHGELRPGTTAVTIAGRRDRIGVWNDKPASTSTSVSFTIFVACEPAFDRCHLLRLSQLGNPLR